MGSQKLGLQNNGVSPLKFTKGSSNHTEDYPQSARLPQTSHYNSVLHTKAKLLSLAL